jgi:hypothetical protein
MYGGGGLDDRHPTIIPRITRMAMQFLFISIAEHVTNQAEAR